jgi:hypothetical protein
MDRFVRVDKLACIIELLKVLNIWDEDRVEDFVNWFLENQSSDNLPWDLEIKEGN